MKLTKEILVNSLWYHNSTLYFIFGRNATYNMITLNLKSNDAEFYGYNLQDTKSYLQNSELEYIGNINELDLDGFLMEKQSVIR